VSSSASILVVDDEPMIRDLLCSYLSAHGYVCDSRDSAEAALDRLQVQEYDLIISDLHMPGAGGLHLLRETRPRYPDTSFLIATAAPDMHTAIEAMRHGAVDFFIKPLDLKKILGAVESAVRRRRNALALRQERERAEQALAERTSQLGAALNQLRAATNDTLQALAMALDLRARDIAGHSVRVSRYGAELALQMGYSASELARFEQASYLHDIGKLGIPDAILNKPAALSPDELQVMRSHVQIGFDLIKQVQSLAPAAELVLSHQEHYDGNGYPRGLSGEAIPRDARIFAVADALDAMTSDRPYRRALTWQDAHHEIVTQSGRQFDPAVVEAFVSIPIERWRELQSSVVSSAGFRMAAAGPSAAC